MPDLRRMIENSTHNRYTIKPLQINQDVQHALKMKSQLHKRSQSHSQVWGGGASEGRPAPRYYYMVEVFVFFMLMLC